MQFSVETVREVARIAGEANLGEITLSASGARLVVKRAPAPTFALPIGDDASESDVLAASDASESLVVAPILLASPCVGVFRAAGLEISVGMRLAKKSLVGIVEALKVPNEIVASEAGIVSSVLVADGQGVEWGQPLFEITPDASTATPSL